MTVRWIHKNIDAWLKKMNPEVAVYMFGTNDLFKVPPDEYERLTREVIQKMLDNGTVVILTTIPPKSGRFEKSKQYAEIVRKIGKELQVPVCDYMGEVLDRRPDDWDGRLPKFAEGGRKGYQVLTLVAGDGTHPSNPKEFVKDFSEEGLRTSGFTLRNYLTVKFYADVIREVLQAK
jgi:lysophospholipase L1-like esterase